MVRRKDKEGMGKEVSLGIIEEDGEGRKLFIYSFSTQFLLISLDVRNI